MCERERQIESVVAESCLELFSHYGITVLPPDDWSRANFAFCAAIGFTGSDLRGSLLLASSREPLNMAGDNIDAIRDWLAELANQMLGRIKNRLLALGTAIYYSTPVILRGQHLAPLDNQPIPHLFRRANGGVVAIWFDVEIGADLILADTPTANAAVGEGEALLF
jgi:hypothetical protein